MFFKELIYDKDESFMMLWIIVIVTTQQNFKVGLSNNKLIKKLISIITSKIAVTSYLLKDLLF